MAGGKPDFLGADLLERWLTGPNGEELKLCDVLIFAAYQNVMSPPGDRTLTAPLHVESEVLRRLVKLCFLALCGEHEVESKVDHDPLIVCKPANPSNIPVQELIP